MLERAIKFTGKDTKNRVLNTILGTLAVTSTYGAVTGTFDVANASSDLSKTSVADTQEKLSTTSAYLDRVAQDLEGSSLVILIGPAFVDISEAPSLEKARLDMRAGVTVLGDYKEIDDRARIIEEDMRADLPRESFPHIIQDVNLVNKDILRESEILTQDPSYKKIKERKANAKGKTILSVGGLVVSFLWSMKRVGGKIDELDERDKAKRVKSTID